MKYIALDNWLLEYDIPPLAASGDTPGNQAPGEPMGVGPGGFDNPPIPKDNNPEGMPQEQEPEDISQDPQIPEVPEKLQNKKLTFDGWRNQFFKNSIKNDVGELIDSIHTVRDDDLDSSQRKFVEDNLQILFLRTNANIDKACKNIKLLIKKELNRNNPAITLVNHMSSVLDTMPELNSTFIKINGLLGAKGDVHRKFLASLLGAIQVGSGGDNEDIVIEENDYSIPISTRFNSQFGEVNLGNWYMKDGDIERYLSKSELDRLEDGSPEEKEVLRKRVIIESIANQFKTRSFIINSVGNDGTIYSLGLDLSNCIKSGYMDGKFVLKIGVSDDSEVMIDAGGSVVSLMDIDLKYVKTEGDQREEVTFISKRNGMLFLSANLFLLRESANRLSGIIFKESPYNGNPVELKTLSRCVPSVQEMLMRNC